MQPSNQRFSGAALWRFWPVVAGVVVAAIGISFGMYSNGQARRISAEQANSDATMQQMQRQLQAMSERIEKLSAPAQQPVEAPEVKEAPQPAQAPQRSTVRRVAPAPRVQRSSSPRPDPRLKQLEAQISDQERRIASTQQLVQENRRDLEGRLTTTKDELDGAVARTHEEVVALQKRGQREYFEFTLTKDKNFRPVGPLSVSLRKADTKRKRYDMELYVDDMKLQKKGVNLFEPVYFTLSDRPHPLEFVVNAINKNEVKGYVSVPKYRLTELITQDPARPKLAAAGTSPR